MAWQSRERTFGHPPAPRSLPCVPRLQGSRGQHARPRNPRRSFCRSGRGRPLRQGSSRPGQR